jgi:hypothetical protein
MVGYLSGGAKPLGRMICSGADCSDPWWSLSDIKVTTVIMCALVVELLCQAVMGHVPALECMSLGTRGRLWLCLVLRGINVHRYPRSPALWPLTWYSGHPRVWLPGVRCVLLRKGKLDRADRW